MILVVVLLDVSGSMALGSRIEALNSNVRTLLAVMGSPAAEPAQPAPFWVAIAAFAEQPMWIVDEPTPPEEVPWAELSPRRQQRADLSAAVADAERFIEAELANRFDGALLVLVTDAAAAATVAQTEPTERMTLLVDSAGVGAQQTTSPEDVLEAARRLLG